ncbi:MAG: cupin domain-containing protein [Actinomycetota bacterium]|nr:cupin domain-containing protein [Actinomycetota bacterium]
MERPESVPLAASEWEDEAPGVRARVAWADGRRWALVEYAPGAERSEWCADGHRGFVLSGQVEYVFDDGTPVLVASAGDGFVLPAGQSHRGRNSGSEPVRIFLLDDRL